jgi:hypothetical protein
MARHPVLLIAASGLALAACVVVAARHESRPPSPVYSVAGIDQHLGPNLPRWLQRPLRVRAIAVWSSADMAGCPARGGQCVVMPPLLVDSSDGTSAALPIVQGPPPQPLALLRSLPFLGQWLWRPQTPRWGQVAVYRIELIRIPFSPMLCLRRPCFAVRLASGWEWAPPSPW